MNLATDRETATSSVRAPDVLEKVAPKSRIRELDGLRGMAILSVLFYHYIAIADSGAAPNPLLVKFQHIFGIGWVGVDLFFVLSGFLIGGILLDARESSHYFGTFYAHRFYRIIPLYYLWIGIFFAFAAVAFHGLPQALADNPERLAIAPIYLLFLQNSAKIPHAAFGTAWLGALWSLAVEEQFYLLMPLAVRFLPRRRLVPLLCLAIAGAPIARLAFIKYLPQHPAAPYMLTLCRADALAVGVLLAIAWRDERWKKLFLRHRGFVAATSGVLLFAFAYLAIWKPSQYSVSMAAWGFSCLDLFFALLLARALLLPGGVWAAVCRWRFLAEMGRISYCFYVIHAAVNLFTHLLVLHREPRFADAPSIVVTVVAAVLAYGLARLSWTFFEYPLQRRGHAYRYLPQRAVVGMPAVAAQSES